MRKGLLLCDRTGVERLALLAAIVLATLLKLALAPPLSRHVFYQRG